MSAWEYFTNQKQWKLYLKNLVKTNDKALLRAIVLVYENQTAEEKNKDKSIEDNCAGFDKVDAAEMSTIARKVKAGKALTESELAKSRNKMPKYWKQLMIISKEKAEAKKRAYDEQVTIEEYESEKREQFQDCCEAIRRCVEEGVSCSYGICDECPAYWKTLH